MVSALMRSREALAIASSKVRVVWVGSTGLLSCGDYCARISELRLRGTCVTVCYWMRPG